MDLQGQQVLQEQGLLDLQDLVADPLDLLDHKALLVLLDGLDLRDGLAHKALLGRRDGLVREVRRWDQLALLGHKASLDLQDLAVLLDHKEQGLRVQPDCRDLKVFKALQGGQDRKVQVLLLKVKLPPLVTFLQYRLQQ